MNNKERRYLLDALAKRNILIKPDICDVDTSCLIAELQDRNSDLSIIKMLLGLKEWHDKKRIIEEIEQL